MTVSTRTSHTGSAQVPRLTDRELEVLRLAAEGLSNREIAAALHLAENTVVGYQKNVSQKLGVHSKLQAVVRGIAVGIIELPRVPGDDHAHREGPRET